MRSPAAARYWLSSLDSIRFEPVRRCDVVRSLVFDTGKPALLADISPGVIGQDFGRGGDDITRVVLSARHEGESVDPITSFPCFVHISIPAQGYDELQSPVRADDLTNIGWGELYRTEDDAKSHRFD